MFGLQARTILAAAVLIAATATAFSDDAHKANDDPVTHVKTEIATGDAPWVPVSGYCCGVEDIGPRLTLRHDFGEQPGYESGFTYLEALMPVGDTSGDSLLFGDARIVNFDHNSDWEFNIGGGYRVYSPEMNRVFGVNLFYDHRHTDIDSYDQIGIGLEALGEVVDFRANGYIVVGDSIGYIGLGNQQIQGNNILRDVVAQVALSGVEVEVGVPIIGLESLGAKGFVGFYHYEDDDASDHATGISGRVEGWLADNISFHFSIQHDDVFATTVSGGLAIHFGSTYGDNWRDLHTTGGSVRSRLGERVVRDPNIVVSTQTIGTTSVGTVPPPPAPPPPPPPPPPNGGNGGDDGDQTPA